MHCSYMSVVNMFHAHHTTLNLSESLLCLPIVNDVQVTIQVCM